jgi:catalase
VHTYNRDGFMRADDNGGASPNYEPNSFGGPTQDPRYREIPYKVSGDVNRYDHRAVNDDYKQAGDLFRLMPPAEKKALIGNIAGHMKGIPERIIKLQIEHFTKADPAYGRGVAEALGVAAPELAAVK